MAFAGVLVPTVVVPPGPVTAAGFVVTNTDDSGVGSLRDALAQANGLAGTDTVTFDPLLSNSTITLTTGTLEITDDIVIDASSGGGVIVSGDDASRVMSAGGDVDVELIGLGLTAGDGGLGGAILVGGDLTLRNVAISNSTASIGGGAALVVGDAFVYDSLITTNSADEGGGLAVLGTALIDNTTLSNNTATDNGGAMVVGESQLTIIDSTVSNNEGCTADGDGGGLAALGPVTISNSVISDNTCTSGDGGGLHVESDEVLPRIVHIDTSTSMTGNTAKDGGALFASGVVVSIADSSLSANAASDDGGAIYALDIELVIDDSTLSLNTAADNGGVLYMEVGTVDIGGSTLSENTATDNGGALVVGAADLTIADSTLSNNSAGKDGGAFELIDGALTMTATKVDDNDAGEGGGGLAIDTSEAVLEIGGGSVSGNTASDGAGGGIWLDGDADTSLSIVDTVFDSNEARDGQGGGLYVDNAATSSIEGARFNGNAATYAGGGISLFGTEVAEFNSVELVDNQSSRSGGAIHGFGVGQLTLRNSTVIDNSAAESGGGLSAAFGNDIIVEDSTIRGNTATGSTDDSHGGGGMSIDDMTSLTVARSTFAENTAADGGGLLFNQGQTVAIADSDFVDNTATERAGGLFIVDVDQVDIDGGSVTRNDAGLGGGAVIQTAESATIAGLTVDENTATENVGGLGIISVGSAALADLLVRNNAAPFGSGVAVSDNPDASITDSIVSGNVSSSDEADGVMPGGGIYSFRSNLVVGASEIVSNTAGQGGGIHATGGSLVLTTGTRLTDNTAESGGGVFAGDAELTTSDGVIISRNTATIGDGGGAAIDAEKASFVDTTIADNNAATDGGGISSNDLVRIETSSVTGNEASENGGGIAADSVTVIRSLFSENRAGTDEDNDGGAIHAQDRVSASHSTFHANRTGGEGGAISVDSDVEEQASTFNFLTVTDNTAGVRAGGIHIGEGGIFRPQGIVAVGNAAPADPDIAFPYAPDWSIISDLGTTPDVDEDGRPPLGLQLGVDPLLGPLGDNGGPTQTRVPAPRSSALDAGGSVSDELVDQRGTVIANGAPHDIGAVKYVGPLPVWVPVTPARLVDTRSSGETIDGEFRGAGTIEAGDTLRVDVAGRGGIPTSATGAIVNVTAVNPEKVGFLTVFPCTETPPNASSVNYTTGVNLPNEVIASLDERGALCIFSSARTHLAVDVVGFLGGPSPFRAVNPSRLLDTRQSGVTIDGKSRAEGRVRAGGEVTVQVAGRAGIPDTAAAAVVNVIAVAPNGTGFVTVHACLDDRPLTSSLNYIAGGNRGNEVLAGLDSSGQICLFTSDEAHLVVDVVGYLDADLDIAAVAPARVFETRAGTPTVDGRAQGVGRLAADSTTRIKLAERAGVPAGATTVNINVTAVNAELNGFLTVFGCGDRPLAASLNYVPGVNGGNDLISGLNPDGELCVYTSAPTDLTIDVTGYTTL